MLAPGRVDGLLGDDHFEIISFENEAKTTGDDAPDEPSGPSPFLLTGACVMLVALIVAGALILFPGEASAPEASGPTTTTTTTTTAPPAFSREVFQVIAPSIVLIQSEGAPGDAPDTEESEDGLGTGVVINAEGEVLTALHVVDGASSITLSFTDGTVTEGTVTGRFEASDIATLAPAQLPQFLVPAVLGGGIQIGDEAYAVGHPLGLTSSLSAGVVSGLDRSLPIDDDTSLDGLIQFDTAVNPGNSGGPLLDRHGRVVGIVTALANPTEDASFSGIGFAVPIPGGSGGIAPGQ